MAKLHRLEVRLHGIAIRSVEEAVRFLHLPASVPANWNHPRLPSACIARIAAAPTTA